MMAMVDVGAVLAEKGRRMAEAARKAEARKRRRRLIEDFVVAVVAFGPGIFFAVGFGYGFVRWWLGL